MSPGPKEFLESLPLRRVPLAECLGYLDQYEWLGSARMMQSLSRHPLRGLNSSRMSIQLEISDYGNIWMSLDTSMVC